MQLPDTSGISGAITTFLLSMVGLSVATERVTETIKQWLGSALDSKSNAHYAAIIQTIAIVAGIIVTALSGLNPLPVQNSGFEPFKFSNHHNWLIWCMTGVLVSGGSAFWNHLLDILQATKLQKEAAAPAPAPAAQPVNPS